MNKLTITYAIIIIAICAMIAGYIKCDSYKGNPGVIDTTVVGTETKTEPLEPSTTHINRPTEVAKKVAAAPKKQVPPPNYDSLLSLFNDLTAKYEQLYIAHYTEKQYQDTARSQEDSSYVVSTSVVFENTLQNQVFDFHPFQRTVTTYLKITEPIKPVRQVYLNYGGGVSYQELVPTLSNWAVSGAIGFSYKDRQDRIYTINAVASTWQQFGIMAIRSGKISFRRKK